MDPHREMELYQRIARSGEGGLQLVPVEEPLAEAMQTRAWPIRPVPQGWVALDPRRPLLAGEVNRLLTTARLGRPLILLDTVDSTNRYGRQLTGDQGADSTVICAEIQTAGKGRLQRDWYSPPGVGLWFSVVFRPPSLENAPPYALLVAVAVCDALEALTGQSPDLKWPNDIQLGGRKACGILVETGVDGKTLVAGIGLNVNHRVADFAPEIRDIATSVAMACGRPFDRGTVLATLLAALERYFDEAARAGFEPMMAQYRTRCITIGRRVRLDRPGGSAYGLVSGIAPDGALLFEEDGGGTTRVMVGDITHLREAPQV